MFCVKWSIGGKQGRKHRHEDKDDDNHHPGDGGALFAKTPEHQRAGRLGAGQVETGRGGG